MADDKLKVIVDLDDTQARKKLASLKTDVKINLVTDVNKVTKNISDVEKSIKNNPLKISTSIDQREFKKFANDLKSFKNTGDSKINLGIKVNNTREIDDLKFKVDKLKADTGGEFNLRFNLKQDANAFSQIKENLVSIKNLAQVGIVIKFAEIGLGAIKSTLGTIKNVAGTGFNLLKEGSLFSSNISTANVGLINTLQNQGKTKEEAKILAEEIFKATKLFSDKTQLTTQEGIQAASILQNADFDILKGKDKNGSINGAGQENILNIVADLAARQQTFLGKGSGEAVIDATRALQELQSGSLISLKTRFNVGNAQVEKAIDTAGLRDKLEFKVDKKTGEETLVKNSLQNLTTEDLTKFATAINRVTNSIGLSEVLSKTNTGLLSTIQSKFEDKILQIFGSDQDAKSFNGKLNAVFTNLIGFFDTDASKKLDQQLNIFGSKLGDFVAEIAKPENITRFGDAIVSFADFAIIFVKSFDPKTFGDGVGRFIQGVTDFFSVDNQRKFAEGLRKFGVTIDTISETIAKDGFLGLINPANGDNVKNRFNKNYTDAVTPDVDKQFNVLKDSNKPLQETIASAIKLNEIFKETKDVLTFNDDAIIQNQRSIDDLKNKINTYGLEAVKTGGITQQEFNEITKAIQESGGNLDILSQSKFQRVVEKIQETRQNADSLGKKLDQITLRNYTLNFDASALEATQQYADSLFSSIDNLRNQKIIFDAPTKAPDFIGPRFNADGGRLLRGETSTVNEKGRELFAGSSGKIQLLGGSQFTAPENGVVIPANITAQILGAIQPQNAGNNYTINNNFTPRAQGERNQGQLSFDYFVNQLNRKFATA
jgi:hypothetical protein